MYEGENGVRECVGENGVRGNSLKGYTKRSGRNPGHSPGVYGHRATVCKTVPCYNSTNGEVLPYRQPYCSDIPRASPPVTTATLSIAFQTNLPASLLSHDRVLRLLVRLHSHYLLRLLPALQSSCFFSDSPYRLSRRLYSVGVTPHTFLNARTKLL